MRIFWRLLLISLLLVKSSYDEPVIVSGKTDDTLYFYNNLTNYIIISTGTGGNLDGMIEFRNAYPEFNIIIDGDCYSACTLLLGMKNVYYTENASFYFHSSYNLTCGFMFSKTVGLSLKGNSSMMEIFNPSIRQWIQKSKAYESLSFTRLPNELLEGYKSSFLPSSSLPNYKRDARSGLDFIKYTEDDVKCPSI